MPTAICTNCNTEYQWNWEDAFDKFGFSDGDSDVQTSKVAACLEMHGYTVEYQPWGLHNVVVTSITKNGIEQIPADTNLGYDNPRKYLPKALVMLLDKELPANGRAVRC